MNKYDINNPKKYPNDINEFNPGAQAMGCLVAAIICAVVIVITVTYIVL